MKVTWSTVWPVLAVGAIIVAGFWTARLIGLAPDLRAQHPGIILGAVGVWVVSSFVAFGFSIFNEWDAFSRLVRLNRAQGNGSARVVAEWYVKKHTWLMVAAATEAGLWALVLTGPAATNGSDAAPDAPTIRGVLYTLAFDAINLCIALVAVGSTIVTRSLVRAARLVRPLPTLDLTGKEWDRLNLVAEERGTTPEDLVRGWLAAA